MDYDPKDPCECEYYAEAEKRIAELEAALRPFAVALGRVRKSDLYHKIGARADSESVGIMIDYGNLLAVEAALRGE